MVTKSIDGDFSREPVTKSKARCIECEFDARIAGDCSGLTLLEPLSQSYRSLYTDSLRESFPDLAPVLPRPAASNTAENKQESTPLPAEAAGPATVHPKAEAMDVDS
jgi:hypothetical protein